RTRRDDRGAGRRVRGRRPPRARRAAQHLHQRRLRPVLGGQMHALRVLALIPVLAGCTDEVSGWNMPAPDPFAELDRLQREGPPRYASRVHSCPKTRYRTLGNLLASRGVDLTATGELTAGHLYAQGAQALGGPSYAARVRENIDLGLSTTAKLFDIYV